MSIWNEYDNEDQNEDLYTPNTNIDPKASNKAALIAFIFIVIIIGIFVIVLK